MKKSNFTALMLGTISGVMFALGMCMTLLPEWNSFKPGIIFGSIGIILGIITVFVWRRMENKPPVKISGKGLWIILIAIIGTLILGVGMSFGLPCQGSAVHNSNVIFLQKTFPTYIGNPIGDDGGDLFQISKLYMTDTAEFCAVTKHNPL